MGKFSMQRSGWKTTLGFALCLSLGIEALGNSKATPFQSFFDRSSDLPKGRMLRLHPFAPGYQPLQSMMSVGNHLSLSGQQDAVTALKSYLGRQVGNPLVEFREELSAHLGLQGKPYQQVKLSLEAGGIDLCGYEVKAHYWQSDKMAIIGSQPVTSRHARLAAKGTWPALQEVSSTVEASSGRKFAGSVITPVRRCYELVNGMLRPSWEVKVKLNDLTYLVRADAKTVYDVNKEFFEAVEGRIQAYTTNPVDGELETFTTELVGDSTLTSEYFETDTTSNPAGAVARARSSNHDFIFDPDEDQFAEASAFIHAVQMHEYFQAFGFAWQGVKPLKIRLHVELNNTKNNALFEPDRDGYPTISIGDGDGKGLKGLPFDADVVSHELGHLVIYRSIKRTSGESLVLHEGLSDFFAFARTGNACLGESICPAGSNHCVVKEQCLRTGDNALLYDTAEYNAFGPHLKGQLVSGMLWDLRDKIDPDYLSQVVYRSLDFMVASSGFADFLVSLLLADQELADGDNACTILDQAEDRGLGDFLDGIDCHDSATWQQPATKDTTPSEPAVEESSSKDESDDDGGLFGCGFLMLGDGAHVNDLPFGIFLFLLIPLCVSMVTIVRQKLS